MTSDAPYPPGERPAEGEWADQVPPSPAAGRYSASASVPVPPSSSPTGPVAPYGGAPAQGQPMQQSGQPFGQPAPMPPQTGPTPPAAGQGRVAASASVPIPPPGASSSMHVGAAQGDPTGHGGPAGQGGLAGPGSAGPGMPTLPPPSSPPYGRLPQGYPQQSAGHAPVGGPGQFGAYGPGAPTGPGGQAGPGGQPGHGVGGGPFSGPAPLGQGGYPQSGFGGAAPQSEPAWSGGGRLGPTGGWPYVDQPVGGPRRRRALLITLIVLGALILVGGSAAIALAVMGGRSPYQVGTCVKEGSAGVEIVDCSSAGAFKIVSIVDSESQCPDANNPVVILTGGSGGREVACLDEAS